jgi:hypothetical protein
MSTFPRSRLKDITIGVLTAREIEQLDLGAAETFYQIASALYAATFCRIRLAIIKRDSTSKHPTLTRVILKTA